MNKRKYTKTQKDNHKMNKLALGKKTRKKGDREPKTKLSLNQQALVHL